MHAVWYGLTIDCRNPAALAAFWAALLGWESGEDDDLPGWRQLSPPDRGGPHINFQPVPEAKVTKVRIHLDLAVDDLDQAVDRVTRLGGRSTGERHEYDSGVVLVMADPEGNEFCLVQHYR